MRMMDPNDSRLVTGTVEEQQAARNQLKRDLRIQEALRCGIEQLEPGDIEYRKFDLVHQPTGRIFHQTLGDPFATLRPAEAAPAFYVSKSSREAVFLAPPATGPQTLEEEAEQKAEREQAKAERLTNKQRPAWMNQ